MKDTMDELDPSADLINTFSDIDADSDLSDLPSSLIVTNVDPKIFSDPDSQTLFESLFREFDPDLVRVQYLKSFRRARVTLSTPSCAAKARIHLHRRRVLSSIINVYFTQLDSSSSPVDMDIDGNHPRKCYLGVPAPHKQFLISPPASPPVGWEPIKEGEPCINLELLAALSNLTPGQAHTLHPATDHLPGIIVHICHDPDQEDRDIITTGTKRIPQTARPDHQAN